MKKRYTFSRNHTFNFDIFRMVNTTGDSYEAGAAKSASGSQGGKIDTLVTILHPMYATTQFFTFSKVFNKLHETVNTLLKNSPCVQWFGPMAG